MASSAEAASPGVFSPAEETPRQCRNDSRSRPSVGFDSQAAEALLRPPAASLQLLRDCLPSVTAAAAAATASRVYSSRLACSSKTTFQKSVHLRQPASVAVGSDAADGAAKFLVRLEPGEQQPASAAMNRLPDGGKAPLPQQQPSLRAALLQMLQQQAAAKAAGGLSVHPGAVGPAARRKKVLTAVFLRKRRNQQQLLTLHSSRKASQKRKAYQGVGRRIGESPLVDSLGMHTRGGVSPGALGDESNALDAAHITVASLAQHLRQPEERVLELAKALLEGLPGAPAVSLGSTMTEEEAEFLSDELGCLQLSSVAATEAGGITQAVSSSSFRLSSLRTHASQQQGHGLQQLVTCVDTPGHAAFASMRRRGAAATDLAILVVAGDEGVKPQTAECVRLLAEKNIQTVVAVTKMDRPGASVDRVKKDLAALGVVSDEDGGSVPFIPVSAKTGEGLADLEAAIALLAEGMPHLVVPPPPLTGAPVAAARGLVLESRVDPHRGRLLHVIVRSGFLREGAWVAVGPHYGRIKKMYVGSAGGPTEGPKQVKCAGMNEAVEIGGLGDMEASAGQLVVQAKNQQQAAKLAAMAQRAQQARALQAPSRVEKLEADSQVTTASSPDGLRHAGASTLPEVAVVLKTGDQGSLEAIVDWIESRNSQTQNSAIQSSRVEEALTAALSRAHAEEEGAHEEEQARRSSLLQQWRPLRVVRSGVGPVNASDVRYAQMTRAVILAFGVSVLDHVQQAIEEAGVPLRAQNIVYRLFDDLESIYDFHFGPKFEMVQSARAQITQVGSYVLKKRKGGLQTVVGLEVKQGTPNTQHAYSLVRNGKTLVEGLKVKSMQKSKESATSLAKGSRDGAIIFDSPFEFQEGDVLIAFEQREKCPPPFLSGHHFMRAPE
ncbi:elongation factor TU GTP-binding domain-containing protein [Cyclospora cayetanensis]|uniref:Elongation factor TU GTP-binding domain-containing protein n=1 Tax=Cyclospora cayetanensis TaxID=88456 RepID=A0A1D3D6L7_9EIME|nr:elongation factor TU GTP-binding domain-containing protein [Cyclospora cayetanensis]